MIFTICFFLDLTNFVRQFQPRLNSHFFKVVQYPPRANVKIKLVPNCHILAGFVIGTLCLATMATLHTLRCQINE